MDGRKLKIPCNHQLEYVDTDYGIRYECQVCREEGGYTYYCSSCKFGAHEQCIDFPKVINYPCHTKHPLKIVSRETTDLTDGECHFCGNQSDRMYHCSLCNFSIDVKCSIIQPPLTIHQPRSHNHALTLFPRMISFICSACGTVGDRNPYFCVQCDLMMHRDCIDLPQVIRINRHEHRISRTYVLGQRDLECGVCRQDMDWSSGAFSCKRCPGYAVHSKCATREDVWDGKELEDEPDEEKDEDPYDVIEEKEIIHFSHEHRLRLGDHSVTVYEKAQCHACILPIHSDPFYKCLQCEFFLHEACANLPRRKRDIFTNRNLTLEVRYKAGEHFECSYCLQLFDGFRYTSDRVLLDVRCATISEPFHHELHPHPLYRTSTKHDTCGACGKGSKNVLRCIVCEYALGIECATLPRKVKHSCDDHVLSLHHGAENAKTQLWCDICEGKTDPSVWFYGCDACGVTLHIKCVLGDMFYLKPGNKYCGGELVPNDGMTIPFCIVCDQRCIFPSFLKGAAVSGSSVVEYACSMKCADNHEWRS